MSRLGCIVVACALAALVAACNELPAVFEDVGNDPHPPELTLLGIGLQLPGDPAPPVAYVSPDAGITVRPFDPTANVLALRVAYADAGGDLEMITVRDLDGPISGDLTVPKDPGAAGTLEATLSVPQSALEGPHRLEIWAEDANESRSPRFAFTVTVEIF